MKTVISKGYEDDNRGEKTLTISFKGLNDNELEDITTLIKTMLIREKRIRKVTHKKEFLYKIEG